MRSSDQSAPDQSLTSTDATPAPTPTSTPAAPQGLVENDPRYINYGSGLPAGSVAPLPKDASSDVLSQTEYPQGMARVKAMGDEAFQHSWGVELGGYIVGKQLGLMGEPGAEEAFNKQRKAKTQYADQLSSLSDANPKNNQFVNWVGNQAFGVIADPFGLAAGGAISKAVDLAPEAMGAAKDAYNWLGSDAGESLSAGMGKLLDGSAKAGIASTVATQGARIGTETLALTALGTGLTALSSDQTGQHVTAQSIVDNLEHTGILLGSVHLFHGVLGKIAMKKKVTEPDTDSAANVGGVPGAADGLTAAASQLDAGFVPRVTTWFLNKIRKQREKVQEINDTATNQSETAAGQVEATQEAVQSRIDDAAQEIADKQAKFKSDIAEEAAKTNDSTIAANPIRSYLNMKNAASLVGKGDEIKDYTPEAKKALEPITDAMQELNTNFGPHKKAKLSKGKLPTDLEDVNPAEELPALQDSAEKLQDANPKGYAKRHAEKAEARLSGLRDNAKLTDWAKKSKVGDIVDNYLSDMRRLNAEHGRWIDTKETNKNYWEGLNQPPPDVPASLKQDISNASTGAGSLGSSDGVAALTKVEKRDAPYQEEARNEKQAESQIKEGKVHKLLEKDDLKLLDDVTQKLNEGQGDDEFYNMTVTCLTGGEPSDLSQTFAEKGGKNG